MKNTKLILFFFSIPVTSLQVFAAYRTFPVLGTLEGIMIAVLFMVLFLNLHSIWIDNSYDFGIIYAAQVESRSELIQFSTQLFEGHKGLKVYINPVIDDWIEKDQIRLIQ